LAPVSRLAFLVLVPWVVACSTEEPAPEPPFRFFDEIRVWARSASAVAVYANAYELLAASDGEEIFLDPACPDVDDDGETLHVIGDCTDTTGRKWTGTATAERDGADRNLTFEAFNGVDGEFARQEVGDGEHEFQAELTLRDVTSISYAGSVKGSYDGPTTWNGSGHLERHGMLSPHGAIDAVTEDEVVDDAECSGQPISGTTTLTAEGETAVITYDGGVDCDAQRNAQLTVNDVDQGLIDGIDCSVGAAGGARRGGWWLSCSVLALLGARRHRARFACTK
jgi:hypothetical protein